MIIFKIPRLLKLGVTQYRVPFVREILHKLDDTTSHAKARVLPRVIEISECIKSHPLMSLRDTSKFVFITRQSKLIHIYSISNSEKFSYYFKIKIPKIGSHVANIRFILTFIYFFKQNYTNNLTV